MASVNGKVHGTVVGRAAARALHRLRGKNKPSSAPQPLAPLTKPSLRAPNGRPRCQYWDIRAGAFYQCPRPARQPSRTCPQHGSGSRKRIENGARKDPTLTPLVTGCHSKLKRTRLRDLIDEMKKLPDPLNLLEELAVARAVLVNYLNKTATPDPETTQAIAGGVAKIAERVQRMRDANAISRPELMRIMNRFAQVVELEVVDPECPRCREKVPWAAHVKERIKDGWLAIPVSG